MSKLIYAADDELNIRQLIQSFLEEEGYEVETFETGDALHFSHIGVFSPRPDTDAVSLFRENHVTLVLPESVGAYASPGAIRVAAFGKNQSLLEL